MQEDNANELKQIFRVQRVPADEWKPLFRSVFYAVSPKGSAEQRVGQDPLAPEQARSIKGFFGFSGVSYRECDYEPKNQGCFRRTSQTYC